MKKYILSISFILSFFIGIGQPVVNRSSNVVTVQDSRLMGQYNLVVPRFADTTAANLQKGIDTSGAIIKTYNPDALWFRQSFPKKWVQMVSSGTSGIFVDSVYSSPAAKTDTLIGTKNGDSFHVKVYDRNCGLIEGGVVTYDSLLIFTVSPAIYILCSDGIRRTSVNTDITLAAADPSNPRIDAIILDINGVNKVTGDAAASPAAPSLTPEQILLTYVLVETSATTIPACTVPNITVYDENTGSPEWAVSGTASENPNNTNFPYHLTKSTDVGAFTNGQTVNFLSPAAVRVRDFTSLKFFIRLKSAFAAATSFQVSWVTTAGNSTVNVLNGTYGFSGTVVGSYQAITIPISAFPNPSPGITLQLSIPATITLRITFVGSNGNGVYFDYIQLGGNCIDQPSSGGGGGTVTSFSSGDLAPLFTTGVTTATTTPALSFTLSNAAAYTNFGNNTSSSGAPSFFVNNFTDSLKRSNDSVFRRVNGNFFYQFTLPAAGTVTSVGLTSPDFDITNTPITTSGDINAVLKTVNSNVGTFGSATQVAQVTVNGKGLTTAATNVTITPAASSITNGQALTKTDDTNVTLTLGGTPSTALLAATSMTLGWTGQLAISRGGTNASTANAAFNNLAPSQTSNAGKVLQTDGTNTSWVAAGGVGTVTSVGLSLPSEITVSGSPVTASGTLTGVWASQSAYNVFRRGSTSGTPSFGLIDTNYIALFSTQVRPLLSVTTAGTSGPATYNNLTGVFNIPQYVSGGGTVTDFSAGNLSPLFTTSVATSTTTPALTFALTNAAGGTVFGNNTGSSGAPAYTAVPVLGIAGTTKGTIGLAGNTSGVVTIQPAAAAGTWNFTLPTSGGTANYLLQTDGSGTTSWASNNGWIINQYAASQNPADFWISGRGRMDTALSVNTALNNASRIYVSNINNPKYKYLTYSYLEGAMQDTVSISILGDHYVTNSSSFTATLNRQQVGSYGSLVFTGSGAISLFGSDIGTYAGVAGQIAYRGSGNISGDILSGVQALSTLASSGNISKLAGLQIRVPRQEAGQTSYSGTVDEYYGVYVADIQGSDIVTRLNKKYAIYQAGSSDTVLMAGRVKLTGGSPGANKILTSDANGFATWQTNTGGTSAFTEVTEEFTGSTSTTVTVSNTPLSTKARMVYINGVLYQNGNVSQTGAAFTLSGITRETSDVVTVKYSY